MPELVLETGIERSSAVLAPPPDLWSYSSLKEVGECPRRFALTHARYPELWDRPRYPTLPSLAALFGNIVHGALEVVVKALVSAGVTSVHDILATDVLRELGGLSLIVESIATAQLAPLEHNPRLSAERRRRLARDLRAQVPEARVQVQTYLSRTAFTPSAATRTIAPADGATSGDHERALQEGSHAEVRLVASDLRLMGRIDLLTIARHSVTIVDYKSGAPSVAHQEQLRLYALLWDRDVAANPDRRVVDKLLAAYRENDAVVSTPSPAELADMADAYAGRVGSADTELRSGIPTATPSEETCRFCTVRQLCGTYWERMVPAAGAVEEGAWFDYEGVISTRNGARSWWVVNPDSGQPELLVRTTRQTAPFDEGDRVRVLGLHRESDPELTVPVAVLGPTAEVFRVEV